MDESAESAPRELRTPTTEAKVALRAARDFFVDISETMMANNPGRDYGKLIDPESFFTSEIFSEAWNDPATSGDKSVDEIGPSLVDWEIRFFPGGYGVNDLEVPRRDPQIYPASPTLMLHVMSAIVAYAVQAMKAEQGGKHDEAWKYAADARYWAGILRASWDWLGALKVSQAEKMNATNPAVELAKKRHAEHYAMSEYVLKYWREKIDPSLSASKAADELLRARVVPLSHKKLAEIVSSEKKKRP